MNIDEEEVESMRMLFGVGHDEKTGILSGQQIKERCKRSLCLFPAPAILVIWLSTSVM
jgi:hypothetical protein